MLIFLAVANSDSKQKTLIWKEEVPIVSANETCFVAVNMITLIVNDIKFQMKKNVYVWHKKDHLMTQNVDPN